MYADKIKAHLIIVPHADDEVLGFGGLIKKLVSNGKIVKVVVTFDTKSLVGEERSESQTLDASYARMTLGYQELVQLKLSPDISSHDLITRYESFIQSFNDEHSDIAVWTTGDCDVHQDHAKVFRCVCAAVRPYRGATPPLLSCEIPSSIDQSVGSVRTRFIANFYVELSQTELDAKITAMHQYQQEYRTGRDRDAILTYARMRGYQIDRPYAEAFMIQRVVVYEK